MLRETDNLWQDLNETAKVVHEFMHIVPEWDFWIKMHWRIWSYRSWQTSQTILTST
jgi:hypothetical protein